MARTTEILSVSVSKEQAKAIEELELSPSSLLQGAIDEAIEHSRMIKQAKKDIESLKNSLWKQAQCLADFLENKNIPYEDYNQFVYSWNKRQEEHGSDKLVQG